MPDDDNELARTMTHQGPPPPLPTYAQVALELQGLPLNAAIGIARLPGELWNAAQNAANPLRQGTMSSDYSAEDALAQRSMDAAMALGGLRSPVAQPGTLGVFGGKATTKAVAESFREVLPKTVKPDETDALLESIKEALGSDWDHKMGMPAAGSQWQRVAPKSPQSLEGQVNELVNTLDKKPMMKDLAPAWIAEHDPDGEVYGHLNVKQFAQKVAGLPPKSLGGILGYGKSDTWGALPKQTADQVKEHLPSAALANSQQHYLTAKPKPSLADEDIDTALAKNPGASIFDLAGVKPKEAPQEPHVFGDLGPLPHGATWTMPGAAQGQPYNALMHHGTRTPVIYDKFRMPEGEIGVHFGTPKAAQDIQGSSLDWSTAPRVYPVAIVAQNPLRMQDLGSWTPNKIAAELNRIGWDSDEINDARYKGLEDMSDSKKAYMQGQQTKNLRQYLESKGHDSIVYKNTVEDPGHDSYILFRESSDAPGHVYGARLPWANFDPAKFKSANIAAGVPLAGAVGAYVAAKGGDLRPVQDTDHNPFPEDSQ